MATTCTRCNGTGTVPFDLDGGRCWGCLGAGTLEAQKAAKPFLPVKSARIERRMSLGGPIDVTIWKRDGVYKVTVSDLETDRLFDSLEDARTAANDAYRHASELV